VCIRTRPAYRAGWPESELDTVQHALRSFCSQATERQVLFIVRWRVSMADKRAQSATRDR
jgi:hypothetical protein